MSNKAAIVCQRCVYDATIPGIEFGIDGICNYCRQYDQLQIDYPTGAAGRSILEATTELIRGEGTGAKYDVVIGVSGGCDSSYMLHLAR
jgi:hypothetical protein